MTSIQRVIRNNAIQSVAVIAALSCGEASRGAPIPIDAERPTMTQFQELSERRLMQLLEHYREQTADPNAGRADAEAVIQEMVGMMAGRAYFRPPEELAQQALSA